MKHRLKLNYALMAFSAVLSLADFVNGEVHFREGPSYIEGAGGFTGGINFQFQADGNVVFNAVYYDANGTDLGYRVLRISPVGSVVEYPGFPAPNDHDRFIRDGNSSGEIVGNAQYTTETAHYGNPAVRWNSAGVITQLLGPTTVPAGGPTSDVWAVNEAGIAVGRVQDVTATGNVHRPVLWDLNSPHPQYLSTFGDAFGKPSGRADAINDSGTIGGAATWFSQSGEPRSYVPVRWDSNGIITQLESFGVDADGYGGGWVFRINENGSAIGRAEKVFGSTSRTRPALWLANSTTPIELEILGTDNSNEIVADYYEGINDSNYAIGGLAKWTNGQLKGIRAVRWNELGQVTELEFPDTSNLLSWRSRAYSINNSGTVAGYYRTNSRSFACTWLLDGTRIDTETIVTLPQGWSQLNQVDKITDHGWIGGYGTFDPDGNGPIDSYLRAFMLLVPQFGTYGLGDANFDTQVNFADLLIVAQNYGHANDPVATNVGDFDLDGDIDFNDLLTIAQHYNQPTFTSQPTQSFSIDSSFMSDWNRALASVPEPGTLVFVSMLLPMISARRRRFDRHPN